MNRSNFLTHWTGKDIETDVGKLDSTKRQQYVERLIGLVTRGFWMTRCNEVLESMPFPGRVFKLGYDKSITCFTELRPSGSGGHSTQYGLMGVVVGRKFVLGGPVHYVRSALTPDGVITNLTELLDWLQKIATSTPDVPDARGMLEKARFLAGFAKAMSKSPDDFCYLEEQEWRIVHSHHTEARGILKSARREPAYVIPFTRDDVEMFVVPDIEVKKLVIDRWEVQKWSEGNVPPMLIVEQVKEL